MVDRRASSDSSTKTGITMVPICLPGAFRIDSFAQAGAVGEDAPRVVRQVAQPFQQRGPLAGGRVPRDVLRPEFSRGPG